MTKPYTSADFSDWNKERSFIDIGVENMMMASLKRTRYIQDTEAEDILSAIEAENVEASQ